jgi:hypothetical protein
MPSWIWRHVLWQIITKVLERLAASIFRAEEGVEYCMKDYCVIFEVLMAVTMKITVSGMWHSSQSITNISKEPPTTYVCIRTT